MSIQLVQSTVYSNLYSGSFGTPTTSGNCVIVGVAGYSSTGPPSITSVTLGGAKGNFSQAAAAVSTYSLDVYEISSIWVYPDCPAGQTAVTAACSNTLLNGSPNGDGITLLEVSGLIQAKRAVDQYATQQSTGSFTWSTGTTGTTNYASEFWVAQVAAASGCSVSTSGWAKAYPGGTVGAYSLFAWQTASTTGQASISGGQNSGWPWAAAIVTLLPAGATPPSSPAITHSPIPMYSAASL
jgi:hypothetical protein